MNRRQFLYKLTLAIGASTYIASCRQSEDIHSTSNISSSPTPTFYLPTKTNTITPWAISQETSEQAPNTPTEDVSVEQSSTHPYLVVARNGEPEELVNKSLEAIGGIERFVKPGSNVIIKPNICVSYHSYEYAVTTNPWIIGSLVNLCSKAGARTVKVMDYPFGGTAQDAYKTSGIEEQVKSAGGEMVIMSKIKYVPTNVPDGIDLKKIDIYDDILNTDVLINVPIAKTHGLAGLTLGMKNLLGVIRDRPSIHFNLSQRIADLNSRIRPTLTVIDAFRILMENGPTGGNLDDVKEARTIIVSPDFVAADSYATSLFGMRPQDLGYINAATLMKLGRSDIGALKIEEININS